MIPSPPGVTPDITLAQKIGLLIGGLPILATLLHAFGVYDLSHEQINALNDALQWGGVVAGTLFAGDAAIRIGRSKAVAQLASLDLKGIAERAGAGDTPAQRDADLAAATKSTVGQTGAGEGQGSGPTPVVESVDAPGDQSS